MSSLVLSHVTIMQAFTASSACKLSIALLVAASFLAVAASSSIELVGENAAEPQLIVMPTADAGSETASTSDSAASSNGCTQLYTIKSGDICYDIWTKNGLTSEQFYKLNPGINCNNLQIGQQVKTL